MVRCLTVTATTALGDEAPAAQAVTSGHSGIRRWCSSVSHTLSFVRRASSASSSRARQRQWPRARRTASYSALLTHEWSMWVKTGRTMGLVRLKGSWSFTVDVSRRLWARPCAWTWTGVRLVRSGGERCGGTCGVAGDPRRRRPPNCRQHRRHRKPQPTKASRCHQLSWSHYLLAVPLTQAEWVISRYFGATVVGPGGADLCPAAPSVGDLW